MDLSTVSEIWSHLRQRYQPSSHSFYRTFAPSPASVSAINPLQQGDFTIHEFYTRSFAIWCQLDSLRSVVCDTCPCCRIVRSDLKFQRIYEFVSWLRLEFEPWRAELFAWGHVPILEVL
jgi:hypothetical protein